MTPTTHRHHPGHRSTLVTAVLAVGLGLAGCTAGTLPVVSTRVSTPTPSVRGGSSPASPVMTASSTPTGLERDIALTGRHFRARCDGLGPAVIVVADYGQSMDESGTLLHDLLPHARVCLYDRLGVGRSDSAPHLQTFASLADDLDGVISGLGLTRPVVVVAQVNGAPIALTWASRHEKDARAVVLTAPTPPGFMGPHGALVRLLPPDDPGDLDLNSLWRELDRFHDPALNRESLDPRSWDAYLRLPAFSAPLYDLVAAPSRPWPASVDGKKVNQAWEQAQSRVLRLSSTSRLVTVATEADWPGAVKAALERALRD